MSYHILVKTTSILYYVYICITYIAHAFTICMPTSL